MVWSLVNKLKDNFSEAKWIAQRRIELARDNKGCNQEVEDYALKRREFDSKQGGFLWMCASVLGYATGNYSRFCFLQSTLDDCDREIE